MFQRVFIANRGDVAARVCRACDELGIAPVLAVSEADAAASYVRGRERVLIGPSRADRSYLDGVRLVQAAVQSRCAAVHPGWGFLSENPQFAALVETHGLTFIGPPAHVMQQMGKKTPAKRAMRRAGLAVIPGSDGVLRDLEHARKEANRVGFPILLKAESGGGGRGMRVVREEAELARAFEEARSEARSAFGDDRVYLERLVEGGRHIEVQVLADRYGQVVHLGERDCTVQRHHQKLVEESPAPVLDEEERARTLDAAVEATRSLGYVGAGTIEFLLDHEGKLRFLEMNTRLQVEHGVSEMCTGVDLVAEQLRVAANQPLAFGQEEIRFRGHAIECRINAEDPHDGFRPTPGTIETWVLPEHEGIRVDTHIAAGSEVSPHYDSLLCKVIAHAADRSQAIARMQVALRELECSPLPTTVPVHQAILASEAFAKGDYDVQHIPGWAVEES